MGDKGKGDSHSMPARRERLVGWESNRFECPGRQPTPGVGQGVRLRAGLTTAQEAHAKALQALGVEMQELRDQHQTAAGAAAVQVRAAPATCDREGVRKDARMSESGETMARPSNGAVDGKTLATDSSFRSVAGASLSSTAPFDALAGLTTANPTPQPLALPSCKRLPWALGLNTSKGMKPVSSGTACQEGMGIFKALDAAAPTRLSCSGGGLSREQQAQLAAKIIARLQKDQVNSLREEVAQKDQQLAWKDRQLDVIKFQVWRLPNKLEQVRQSIPPILLHDMFDGMKARMKRGMDLNGDHIGK
ncbi:hypothetical protein ABBQ38_006815 [Trebouxia sp. C0009 RCD-2024]